MPRRAHPSIRKQLTDMAARNRFSAQAHLGIVVHLKSHLSTKIAQHVNVSRRFVSEVEVVAFVNFAGVQALLQNLMRELVRGDRVKISHEGNEQTAVNNDGLEQEQVVRN